MVRIQEEAQHHAGLKVYIGNTTERSTQSYRNDMKKCENDVRCRILNLKFRLGYGGSIPPKAQNSIVVQLVECQSVTLVVAGSSPVGTANTHTKVHGIH